VEAAEGRRAFLISKTWIQVVLLVVLFGFFVLGLLAYRTYVAGPPVPSRVVDPSGATLFTGSDISAGQRIFLNNGLMEYGSAFGHGAYLGPDYTADYLRRASNLVRNSFGGSGSDSAARRTVEDFRTNRYGGKTNTLVFSRAQALAFRRLVPHYSSFFSDPKTEHGLLPHAITDPRQLRQLTAFFAWTAWAAAADRPGHNYSYTNNWPPEPRVENEPTANVIVWSVLSLIALLGGIGLLFAAFGRWGGLLGWHGREQATLSFRAPGDVALTPAQRATVWFFFVMAALFLIQTFVGAASQHYRADIDSFFGFDLARWFPYNLMRTWHVQLAIFWVATSFVAAGIFLAPMIARREPRHQDKLAFGLLGALAVVVFGTLIGSYLALHGTTSNWLGLQGLEYLDLARFWQILLTVGLVALGLHALAGASGSPGEGAPRQHAVALLPRSLCDSRVLCRRPDRAHRRQLHHGRVLALLGRPPLGGGLPRAVHDRDGRLHVRAARRRPRAGRADGGLPRHPALLGRRGDRDDAPPVLLRRARRAHGARSVLLSRGGDPAHVPHGGGVVVPTARSGSGVSLASAVPAPLGGDVPRGGRLLELPRSGHLRLPDQPAHRLLLRDRHRADREPRARGDDGASTGCWPSAWRCSACAT
jgi:hypothetical protein